MQLPCEVRRVLRAFPGGTAAAAEINGQTAIIVKMDKPDADSAHRPGVPIEGPYLIVDCSAAEDLPRHRRNGKVAEVDWQTAQRWRMRGPLDAITLIIER